MVSLLILSFFLNLASALVFTLLFYHRYKERNLFKTIFLFNILVYLIMVVLSFTDFSLTVGIGLFFLLSMFRLRSTQIENISMTYWFGAIVLGMLNGLQMTTLELKLAINAVVLLAVWLVDSPLVFRGVDTMDVTLDEVETRLLTNGEEMLKKLSERFNVVVLKYRVLKVDYIKDTMRLEIHYRRQQHVKAE